MRIVGYQYQVSYAQPDPPSWGDSDHRAQTIVISPRLSPAQTTSTMLHEVLEAVNFVCGLELPHTHICTLEAVLFQVLTDAGVDLAPLVAELEE